MGYPIDIVTINERERAFRRISERWRSIRPIKNRAAKSYHYYCLSAFIHIHSLNSSRIKSVRLNELLKHPLQLILLHLPQAPLSLLTSLDKTDGMKDSGQSKQDKSRGFIGSWGSNPGIRPIHQPSKASHPFH